MIETCVDSCVDWKQFTFKQSGIFPFNQCAVAESSLDPNAFQWYKLIINTEGWIK